MQGMTTLPNLDEIPTTLSLSARTKPPVLGTVHPVTKKKMLPKAFTIPLHTEQMMRFVDHYFPEMYRAAGSEKLGKFMNTVQNYLPDEWDPEMAWVLVPIEGKIWHTLGIVICGNRTKGEMKKADDAKTIRDIQRTLDIETPPGWYFVADDPY
ncbi:hypothetical protein DFP72DRAFT_42580 [Ephemerocybe angulata]|uniref:Uncharacterized protein n=1 Tax=Ephemerocybe angulata TaxID=980116 RepID=A0A8H6LWV9_9AGAR|nr:hypothetical protein DFP72DRAFT_42580 [Tulosesus angulatus]